MKKIIIPFALIMLIIFGCANSPPSNPTAVKNQKGKVLKMQAEKFHSVVNLIKAGDVTSNAIAGAEIPPYAGVKVYSIPRGLNMMNFNNVLVNYYFTSETGKKRLRIKAL